MGYPMRCVIFDLDGTIADTSGDLIAAANHCFRGLGHGDLLDPARDQATAVQGARAMLKLGFDRLGESESLALIDAQFPVLIEAYGHKIDAFTVIYPGAIEAIEQLRQDGYVIGLCTNKPAGLAETLLTRLGIRDLFASLIGADTLPVRKPDPAAFLAAVTGAGGDPARALLVGDTRTDHDTARAAGVPSVLVGFGPAGMTVTDLDPDAILGNYSELSEVVKRLIG